MGLFVPHAGHIADVPPAKRKPAPKQLTIAITGPTGTFGHGLVPLLQADKQVRKLIGVARRPFEPDGKGWTKMEYRQGDVRDRDTLVEAFEGADAVAHLAFAIYGNMPRETLRAINVDGTMNAFRAAAEAGVKRFVYASSVATYGFHADNPIGITEEWPIRGSEHLFYSQEKAEIEHLLHEAASAHPEIELTLFRPGIVLGPNAVGGGEEVVPKALRPLARGFAKLLGNVPLPLVPSPQPLQFVHEADVGQAFHLALLGRGPAGTYNLIGDGVLTGEEVWRELGLLPLPVPAAATKAAARAVLMVPGLPAVADWAEAALHPVVVDASKAKRELGWKPAYTGAEALRDTLPR
jgi:nucleoside-diphosphate-sugar epimerase